jgi:predicted O-methyltransferase YrrM
MNGFNSDNFIKNEIENLIKKFDIKSVVETGTYYGQTTAEFSKMVDKVFTIEINEIYYLKAKDLFAKEKINNIISIVGSSPLEIKKIFTNNSFKSPALFYLDAHWYNYNPLIDELKEIANANIKNSIIVIHDFKVPGKNFGFDKFPDGKEYTFDNIKKQIENIYGNNYGYHYNTEVEGACRGIIFIYPKL